MGIVVSRVMYRFNKARQIASAANASSVQKRFLNLHEYQSLQLMKTFGVSVPRFEAAVTPREVSVACQNLGDCDYVVKAQVLAGGRGLGYFKENGFQGGVHVVTSAAQAQETAAKMLGNTLITKQTGEQGKPCKTVLIAERFYIRKEKYLAILMDRASGGPIMIGSSVGGMNIEDIAHNHPEAIVRLPVSLKDGLSDAQAKEFAQKLDFSESQLPEAVKIVKGLYKMFIEKDCTMVEVNPLAETADGRVMVCDAKVNFDDNAAFRQGALHNQRDTSQEDPREVAASRFDLNYVGLDGNIGCMVNGAGLAMATMDIIKLNGGSPANFLDIGGGASENQVVEAFRILQNDPNVKAILVNIFGGIMRCDLVALGIISATQKLGLSKPLVVRLEGTKQDEAKKLIDESGLKMVFCNDLSLAAQRAVKMTEIMSIAESSGLKIGFEL
eukprot:GDKJ01040245.1.p1 GENE.GDKJ01040245.1~~GDKJ01040245.1.p1  ORF type:complete len:442 (-),score=144.97 GDKJ01040245.1:995-2320(-)